MSTFAIAGLQLDLPANDDNSARLRARAEALLAHYPWVQMVVFSELAACGPLPSRARPIAEAEAPFQALARQHSLWVLSGSVFEKAEDGKVYNTASVFDPSGALVGRYRKLFPFLPYERGVEAGDSFLVFDVPGAGRFGVSICYDLWFPETARTLAGMGAEVILHPVMTTTIDRDVELAIARATAATQQCWVVDVNGAGEHGVGRSIVVGPEGDVVHTCGSGDEVFPLQLDLARVRRTRETGLLGLGQVLKSFRDRRVDFPVYTERDRFFLGLGPLEKPRR